MPSALKTFDQLMECAKIKELDSFITKETYSKYDKQGLMPHYIINGIKAYKISEIMKWIKDELIECYDGFRIISKFYSFNHGIKKPPKVPQELIHHSKDLFELCVAYPPCVYFLLDNAEIVYVGQSVNVSARVVTHSRDKDFTKVLYMPVVQDNLNKVERFFIERMQPKYNEDRFIKNKVFKYKNTDYNTLINMEEKNE